MTLWLSNTEITGNPLFDVSRGFYTNASIVHKFGANFDIDTTSTPETVWTAGGVYPWSEFDTPQTLYCVSTDAADTESLIVEGLDSNWDLQTETIIMTGTTAVATLNTFKRVFRMSYIHDDRNAGTITARTVSGAGVVVAQVDIDTDQTLMALYTIPAGHTAYLTTGDLTISAKKDARLGFYTRLFNETFLLAHIAETTGYYSKNFAAPLPMPAKTDFDVRITSVGAVNTKVTASFHLVLVKD